MLDRQGTAAIRERPTFHNVQHDAVDPLQRRPPGPGARMELPQALARFASSASTLQLLASLSSSPPRPGADSDVLDLMRSRTREHAVLDILHAPPAR